MPLNLPSVPLRCHLHGWSQRLSLSLPAATLLPPPPPHSPSSSHSDPPSLSSAVTSDGLPVLVSHLPPPLCASTAFPPQPPQPGAALSLTTTHGHPPSESDTAQARLTAQGLTPVSLVSQLFPARFPPAGADAAERCPLALPGSMPSARGRGTREHHLRLPKGTGLSAHLAGPPGSQNRGEAPAFSSMAGRVGVPEPAG